MTTQTNVQENDVVDFSKRGGRPFSHLGKCVVVEKKIGRVQNKYIVTQLSGANAGTNRILTIRYAGLAHGELAFYCDIVGKNKKVAEKKRTEKVELQTKRYNAAAKATEVFEAGDIVTIKSSKGSWNMKVLNVDFTKGRITGVNADHWSVGSKAAWASLTHPDVKITMKQKKAFDPETDPAVVSYKAKAARAGEKRAVTRARRKAFSDVFGF